MLRRPRRLLLLVALTALLPACSGDVTNPLAGVTRTVPPPADANLAYTANDWSGDPASGRELFSVRLDGSQITRLTFCNDAQPCDMIEAAFASDRTRAAIRQRLAPDQPPSLEYFDMTRGASAELVPAAASVSGVDWSQVADILAYSAIGTPQGTDDIFRTNVQRPTTDNQQSTANLTCVDPSLVTGAQACDPTVDDRRPRLDQPSASAVFERIPQGGKGEIYKFLTTADITLVAAAGPGSGTLPGTKYVVGGNADPDYSPDATEVVFRRLTAVTEDGLGTWDLLVASTDGTSIRTLVTGAAFRGAPDWGASGIAFPERDPATGQFQLVVVQPDGSGRQVVVTLAPGFTLSYPRWLS